MKKSLFFVALFCAQAVALNAANKYVSPTGDNANDGKSWKNAKAEIQAAVDASAAGDTVFVAQGTYNETVSLKDGVSLFGGYDAATGSRNVDVAVTVLDGTGLDKWVIVRYDNDCTVDTYVDGFVMQNAEHSHEGGAAYIRGKCYIQNCTIRNCFGSNGGAVMIDGAGWVSNCLIELCSSSSSGGAIRNKGGIVENCIIRGCQGKYGTIRNDSGDVINCVIYNCSATVSGWPDSGGIYNPGGRVINCTLANNFGNQYAGIHSDNITFNTVMWGNQAEEGFADPVNYISGSTSSSGDNAANEGFDKKKFTLTLSKNNMDATGPNFVAPTTFVGIPTNDGQIAAMRAADFSLLSTSPLIDKGRSTGAPAVDVLGVTRPKGTKVDLGAYEYDPNAQKVAVTGVQLNVKHIDVAEENTAILTPIFTPSNASNRSVTWTIGNDKVATISTQGVITGVSVGSTWAAVKTADGGFTDTATVVVTAKPIIIIHPEVLAADSLYPIANYTVPSYIPFWAAKEAARSDSSKANLQAMREKIQQLVGKEEPYNIIANINGNVQTNMGFCWFTNEGVTKGKVQLVAKANAEPGDFVGAIELDAEPTTTKSLNYAVSTSGIIKATHMPSKQKFTYVSHKALATNLTPGTTYSYRVGYDDHWSAIYSFHTAPATGDKVSVIYMSDSHIQDQEYVENARWCAQAAAKHDGDADFCIFPGDFVETGTAQNSEWEWERWFEESMLPILKIMPVAPTDGNHDDTNNLNYNYHFNTDYSFNQRSLKVKPQFSGITYSIMYGKTLFLVYSLQDYWRGSYSYSSGTCVYLTTDVGNWFREQVAAYPDAQLRITLSHKNVFSGSGHQEDEETPMFRSTMLPIYKQCEVDFAIQGHDHCYEMIGPVNPDTRTPITSAISDVQKVTKDASTNMTGLKGGTYVVDDGTMYFIGATCGRKRYYPYTREEMDAQKSVHKVNNYFDLFTGMFGQPGSPSYTRFDIDGTTIIAKSYKVDSKGNVTLINEFTVKRTKPHTIPEGVETVMQPIPTKGTQKILRNGEILLVRDGIIYNALGQELR